MKRLGVALLGAGRMGQEHARALAGIPEAEVVAVADPDPKAREMAAFYARAQRAVADPGAVLEDPAVEAVIIVTPTATHAEWIERAARAGKAIFVEKPVAETLEATRRALAAVRESGVPFQVGFQRRFDPGYRRARELLDRGALGRIDQFRAVGRDPAPPPLEYLKSSGGLFLDMAIHDFDLARFLVGEVAAVLAVGAARVDPRIGEIGDVDTATTLLFFEDGVQGVVENSRQTSYGYDIRTEVFGEKGKIVVDAVPKTPTWYYCEGGLEADHYYFFMDRFKEAYRAELEAFVKGVLAGKTLTPGPEDAEHAFLIGLAATKSQREGRVVSIKEVARA